jgi:hypothetical protein
MNMKTRIIALLLSLLAGPAYAADITSNLVARWAMDEGSGASTADDTGNGNTGTLQNTPTWAAGQIGAGSLTFTPSSNEYVSVSVQSSLNITGPITVAAWVKIPDTASVRTIVGNRTASSGGFTWNAVNDLQRFIWFSVAQWDCPNGTIIGDGAWHHYVITVPTSGSLTCYVDGSSGGTAASAAAGSGAVSGLTLGAWNDETGGGLSSYLDGSIDEVRIYSRALTGGDVAELFAFTGGGGVVNGVIRPRVIP